MICASIQPESAESAARLFQRARDAGAEMIEIRAERLAVADVADAVRRALLPVLVACRQPGEIRRAKLRAAASAAWLDVEEEDFSFAKPLGPKILLSFHDYEGVPPDLERRLARIESRGADAIKIACTPRTTGDLLRLLELRPRLPHVVLGMGEWGEPTRVLYRRMGSLWTYAWIDPETKTAPGQLSVAEMRETYAADRVGPSTRVFGVVGNPVRHSPGPQLWNRAFRDRGIDAVYARFPVEDARRIPDLVRTVGISGLSVTTPHKEAVPALLDSVSEAARRIGAVNTIRVEEGGLHGDNTDKDGIIAALESLGVEAAGRRALVFGAGGTAAAALYALARRGADCAVANRTEDRARRLAGRLGAQAVRIEEVTEPPDVIVQATTVGMAGPTEGWSVVPRRLLRPGQACIECIHTPRETAFVREARAAGARVATGDTVYLGQMAAQFRWLVGVE